MEAGRVKKGGSKKKRKGKLKRKQSDSDLLKLVEEKLGAFQYEEALALCESAIATDPSNVKALETAAPILLELGGEEKAYEYLRAAVQLSPDSGYSKYMYLGQMCSGDEAVTYITKGLELMAQLHASGEQTAAGASSGSAVSGEEVSAEKLSNGYCTLAEMYLTDCCFTEDAEIRCFECCTKAIATAPQNPEAHQVMASYLLSKDNTEGAKESLVRCLELWLPNQGAPGAILPPYPARVNCVKLLMEVEEMEKASCILEHLLKEDDEVVEVWYLLGWLNYLTQDMDAARFYLTEAETLFRKVECDDMGMLEHIQEVLKEVETLCSQGNDGEEGGEDKDLAASDQEPSSDEMELT